MEKLSNCYRLLYFAVLLIFLLKQTAGCGSWEGPSTKQTTRDRPRVTEMAQELPTTDKITRTKRGAVPLFPPSTPQPYPPRLYPPPRYRPPPFIPPPSVIQRRRILGIAYRLFRRQRIKRQCGKDYLRNQTNAFDKANSFSHSWPWLAGLHKVYIASENKSVVALSDTEPFCTASVVTEEFLITTMHCLMGLGQPAPAILPKNIWFAPEKFVPYNIFIKVGNHYKSELADEYREVHLVEAAYVFTEGLNYPMADIALLKVRKRLIFYGGVTPVCLPNVHTKLPIGTQCFTVGLTRSKDMRPSEDKLVEVTTSIRQVQDCQKRVSFARETNHVCASVSTKVPGNLSNGGGLYCKIHPDDNQYYLIGLPTFGWQTTGLFASISPLMRYIDTLIGLG